MEYYLALKRKEILTCVVTGISLKNTTLSEQASGQGPTLHGPTYARGLERSKSETASARGLPGVGRGRRGVGISQEQSFRSERREGSVDQRRRREQNRKVPSHAVRVVSPVLRVLYPNDTHAALEGVQGRTRITLSGACGAPERISRSPGAAGRGAAGRRRGLGGRESQAGHQGATKATSRPGSLRCCSAASLSSNSVQAQP